MKLKRKIFSSALSSSLILGVIGGIPISANGLAFVDEEKADSYSVSLTDHSIVESIKVTINGRAVIVNRETLDNNNVILTITENGVTQIFNQTGSYELLLQAVKGERRASYGPFYGRVAGYNYRYMKAVSSTDYLTPKNNTYSIILATVSGALGSPGLPGSTITGVASMIFAANGAPVETKLVTTRHRYEVTEKSSGGFIGYHCEYVVDTYVRNSSGGWTYLGSQTGEFDRFEVY